MLKATYQKLLEKFKPGDLLFGLTSSREPYLDRLEEKKLDYYSANHLNVPLVENLVKDQLTEEYIKSLPEEKAIHARLLLQHKKKLLKPGGKDPWDGEDKIEKSINITIRRACKLLAITNRKTKNKKKYKIFFLLDGINMARVCSGKKQDGEIDTSISSAELRAIYRNRTGMSHCIFFKNGKVVKAPWNEPAHKKYWKQYQKRREEKKAQRVLK